jgi:hypothetical protein
MATSEKHRRKTVLDTTRKQELKPEPPDIIEEILRSTTVTTPATGEVTTLGKSAKKADEGK